MKVLSRSRSGDIRSASLTDEEMAANDYFNDLLDEGYGIVKAVDATRQEHPGLDARFYDEWLGR